jgi:hypothetical protein
MLRKPSSEKTRSLRARATLHRIRKVRNESRRVRVAWKRKHDMTRTSVREVCALHSHTAHIHVAKNLGRVVVRWRADTVSSSLYTVLDSEYAQTSPSQEEVEPQPSRDGEAGCLDCLLSCPLRVSTLLYLQVSTEEWPGKGWLSSGAPGCSVVFCKCCC